MEGAFILRPQLTGHRILLLSNLNLLPTCLIHSLFLIYKTHQTLGFGYRDLEIILPIKLLGSFSGTDSDSVAGFFPR